MLQIPHQTGTAAIRSNRSGGYPGKRCRAAARDDDGRREVFAEAAARVCRQFFADPASRIPVSGRFAIPDARIEKHTAGR